MTGPEYTSAAVLALGAGLLVAAWRDVATRRSFWIALAAFTALTVAGDGLLTAAGVFSYDHRFLAGVVLGRMPVEDLLYGAALFSVAVAAARPPGHRHIDLWRVSRPYSWINTALPCLACGLAVGRPTVTLGLAVLYFLGPYNLLMYGANDHFDFESDRRNPRKGGGVEGGLAPPRGRGRLWLAIAASNLPLLAVLGAAGGPLAAALLAFTAFTALAYSVPPLRFKAVPGLDSLTSALHFVLPAVCGGLLAGAGPGALPWRYLGAFVLWGAASQALGSIQDVEYDRAAGTGSIAVSLGARPAAALSAALYAAAVLIVGGGGSPYTLAAAAALLPYPVLAASCLAGDPLIQARRAWKGFLGMNLLSGFLITQVFLRVWGLGNVTPLQMLAGGSAVGVALLIANLGLNRRRMRRPRTLGTPPGGGVSVVVPVLNEVANLAACLTAIPVGVEMLVVDDGSTDGSAELARRLRPDAHVISAGPLRPGWTGKCQACAAGAARASGAVLVFLDADTVLQPGALDVAAAACSGGGLVSFLSRFDLRDPFQKALMPAFGLMHLALWPHWLLPLAYGPFMAARREDYERAGGHAGIATSPREDLDLARAFAAAGLPVRTYLGPDLAATRHYRSAGAVAAAWRRMYYAYAGGSLAVALAGILGLATVFLLPLALVPAAWAAGDGGALAGALAGGGLLVALRVLGARTLRQPATTVLWHPVTWVATFAFMALSVYDGLRGRPPQWRGRPLGGALA